MGGGATQSSRRAGYIPEVSEIVTPEELNRPLIVRGRALAVAGVVAVVLLAAAGWAAQIDLASVGDRDSAPLEALSDLYKLLSIAGLLWLGRKLRSRSLTLLGLLLLAMFVGGLLIHTDWFSDVLHSVTDRVAGWLPVSSGSLQLAFIFVVLAVVAGWLVWLAYAGADPLEKPAVVTLIGLLFVVGIFVGPVNAISSLGINREWLFAEDFGQVVALALLTGYVAGLVAATAWDRK